MGKQRYSSLLSLDDLMTQIQGDTSTESSFIQGIQKKRKDNNKSISTFEKDFYNEKIKFSVSKKEKQAFEEALQKELEIEKAFEEQEKQLELQNRISKLSPDLQETYFEWKKKGIDKLNEIEKLNKVGNKGLANSIENYSDASFDSKMEGSSYWRIDKLIPLGVTELIVDAVDNVINPVINTISEDLFDTSIYKEKREKDKLNKELKIPIAVEKKEKLLLEYENIKKKRDLKQIEVDSHNKSISNSFKNQKINIGSNQPGFSQEFYTISNMKLNPYDLILENYEKQIKHLESVENDGGFGKGFTDEGVPVLNGFQNLITDVNLITAANNIKNGKNSEIDNAWMEFYKNKQQLEKFNFNSNNKSYETGLALNESLSFLGETFLTMGIGKAVATSLRGGIKIGSKQLLKSVLKEIGEEGIEKIAEKSLKQKAIDTAYLGTTGAIGMGVQSQFMTNTYTSGIEKMLGNNIQVIEDENGKEKIVVGKKAKENVLKQANISLNAIELREQELKEKLTGDAKLDASVYAELEKIQNDKNKLYGVLEQIGTPADDISYGEAHTYGTIQTMAELFSEKYVGRFLDKMGGSYLGKFADKTPGLKQANKLWKKGQELTDNIYNKAIGENSKLAKLSPIAAQALRHSGKSGKIINSLPSEIGEEIFVQLVPNNLDNYEEQVDHLFDPE